MARKIFILILSICVIFPLSAFLNPSGIQKIVGNMKIGAVIINYCTHNDDFATSTSVDGYAVCDPGDFGGYNCSGCSLTADYFYIVIAADLGWNANWYVGSGSDSYKYVWSPSSYVPDPYDIFIFICPECGHGISW